MLFLDDVCSLIAEDNFCFEELWLPLHNPESASMQKSVEDFEFVSQFSPSMLSDECAPFTKHL